jgi:hypothetical protein
MYPPTKSCVEVKKNLASVCTTNFLSKSDKLTTGGRLYICLFAYV